MTREEVSKLKSTYKDSLSRNAAIALENAIRSYVEQQDQSEMEKVGWSIPVAGEILYFQKQWLNPGEDPNTRVLVVEAYDNKGTALIEYCDSTSYFKPQTNVFWETLERRHGSSIYRFNRGNIAADKNGSLESLS